MNPDDLLSINRLSQPAGPRGPRPSGGFNPYQRTDGFSGNHQGATRGNFRTNFNRGGFGSNNRGGGANRGKKF